MKKLVFDYEMRLSFSAPVTDHRFQLRCIPSIVSDVELTQGEELSVAIEAAEGECCDRCWNYRTTVGEYNGHAHICKRCANAL